MNRYGVIGLEVYGPIDGHRSLLAVGLSLIQIFRSSTISIKFACLFQFLRRFYNIHIFLRSPPLILYLQSPCCSNFRIYYLAPS